jgi:hypothetical protein
MAEETCVYPQVIRSLMKVPGTGENTPQFVQLYSTFEPFEMLCGRMPSLKPEEEGKVSAKLN